MEKFRRRNSWHASRALVVVFALFLLPFAFAHDDIGRVSTSTREGRLAVFDDVWQTVYERYYDPNFYGVDWLVQCSVFRPPAADASGPPELYALLRRVPCPVEEGHKARFWPGEKVG